MCAKVNAPRPDLSRAPPNSGALSVYHAAPGFHDLDDCEGNLKMTTEPPEIEDESGAPDRPCANCGHPGHQHLVRDVELPGRTVRETFCSECGALCEFVPEPNGR